jgi:hypothetical protein
MKKKAFAVLFLLGISILLVSCATHEFIPVGSKSYGSYYGRFSGMVPEANGGLRIHFFETPEGEIRFRGVAESEARQGGGQFFHGTVKDKKTLEGVLDAPAVGTITGQLSEDRSYASGTFESDLYNTGTWKVDLKKSDQ